MMGAVSGGMYSRPGRFYYCDGSHGCSLHHQLNIVVDDICCKGLELEEQQ